MTAAVALAVAAASVVLPAPPLLVQLCVLAPLVAVFGLPHGAYDGTIAEGLLRPRFGRGWPAVFGVGYLGLAAVVLVLWWAAPVVGLAAFLAYSAVHFGLEDAEGDPAATRPDVLARGALPIAAPAVFHAGDVATVFGWLLPMTHPVAPSLVRAIAAPVVAVAVTVLARRPRSIGAMLPIVAVLLAAPPLVGFAVYFCLWHSVRHASTLAAQIDARHAGRAWATFARRAAPATALTAAAAAAAGLVLARTGRFGPAAATAIFVTLAALTVPHMALAAWRQAVAGRTDR